MGDFRSCCPVHMGDNSTAFSYNLQSKRWRCFTHDCHEGRDTIIGLVEAVQNVGFPAAVKWLANLLGVEVSSEEISEDPLDKIISQERSLQRVSERYSSRDNFQKMRPIPIEKLPPTNDRYFRKQGFAPETLRKFHVGFCDDATRPMYNRAFAPVLDVEGKNVIGVTGRTVFEQCPLCRTYHADARGCPSDGSEAFDNSKWKHFGFKSGTVLYNMCNARHSIQKKCLAVITEGPKDVWWLDQHGIDYAVALLRKDVLDLQIKQLLENGATRVILCLNNDDVSNASREKTIRTLNKYFKVVDITSSFKTKDVSEVPKEEMLEKIVPLIRRWELPL